MRGDVVGRPFRLEQPTTAPTFAILEFLPHDFDSIRGEFVQKSARPNIETFLREKRERVTSACHADEEEHSCFVHAVFGCFFREVGLVACVGEEIVVHHRENDVVEFEPLAE